MTPEELQFNQYFLYPFILLLTGSLMTGILIPWYTNRQKNKQNEIEKWRIKQELEKDRLRQDYEFKIKLKQELVNTFHTYWISTFSAIGNFNADVFSHFSINYIERVEGHPGQETSQVRIPDDDGKYPSDIFLSSWNEVHKTVGEKSSEYSTLFMLKLSWYSNNNELVDEFEKIRDKIRGFTIIQSNIINSKNVDDYVKYGDEFVNELDLLYKELKEFRDKLVRLRIDEVVV